jgi:carbon-monoxide dehydrogenase medium subunit
MSAFQYHSATSVADAMAKAKAGATLLSGGMSLIPTVKLGLAAPSGLVDLNRIADMKGIGVEGGDVVIAAATTHAAVAASRDVAGKIPALAALASGIGDPQVRHRGTIGGSIANDDPAADYPAACLGLGATIVTDSRSLPADDFFQGLFQTALKDGEIVTAVRFPVPRAAAYVKFPHPATRFALVGVFVAKTGGGVRVAVTGAGDSGVFRASTLEAALDADFSADAAARVKFAPSGMLDDIHGSAEYRAHLIGVLARRAVASCA